MMVYFNSSGEVTSVGRAPDSGLQSRGEVAFDQQLNQAMFGLQDIPGADGFQSRYSWAEADGGATSDWQGEYSIQQVGETQRAPMAMFGNDDELIVSTISRNGIAKSPVYSYDELGGLRQRGQLPDEVESGNYGFTAEDGIHVVAESWRGMVEYVAPTPDGPWEKHDLTSLNPHEYKNLKWGFGTRSPLTGNQYLGFGNDQQPGVVLTRESGSWQVLAAPDDMLFPTSMGEITSGENSGTRLICSSTYGETRLHAVDADGTTRKLAEFDGWSYMTADPTNEIVYVASESGQVYWSRFDDLENWQPVQAYDAQGNLQESIGRAGEINIHPGTGQVILPAADSGWIGNNEPMPSMGTTIYAAELENGVPVFRAIDRIEGAGLWELRTAQVGDDLYFGTGLASSQKQDGSAGAIYRIGASGLDDLAAARSYEQRIMPGAPLMIGDREWSPGGSRAS